MRSVTLKLNFCTSRDERQSLLATLIKLASTFTPESHLSHSQFNSHTQDSRGAVQIWQTESSTQRSDDFELFYDIPLSRCLNVYMDRGRVMWRTEGGLRAVYEWDHSCLYMVMLGQYLKALKAEHIVWKKCVDITLSSKVYWKSTICGLSSTASMHLQQCVLFCCCTHPKVAAFKMGLKRRFRTDVL